MHEPLITVTGNVAQAPVLRAVAGSTPVASFRVATTPRRRGKNAEEWLDGETIWFGVSAWRSLGEHCASSLKKGDRVVVTGRFTARTWTSADGKDHLALEVDATTVGLELSRDSAVSLKQASPRKGPQVDPITGELLDGPLADGEVADVALSTDELTDAPVPGEELHDGPLPRNEAHDGPLPVGAGLEPSDSAGAGTHHGAGDRATAAA